MDKELRNALWSNNKEATIQRAKVLIELQKDCDKLNEEWWLNFMKENPSNLKENHNIAVELRNLLATSVNEWPWQFWFELGRLVGKDQAKANGKKASPNVVGELKQTAERILPEVMEWAKSEEAGQWVRDNHASGFKGHPGAFTDRNWVYFYLRAKGTELGLSDAALKRLSRRKTLNSWGSFCSNNKIQV